MMPKQQYNPLRYSSSRTYRIWSAMCCRCHNPNFMHYANYGGRGILICRVLQSSRGFLKIMGEAPENGTLDRKDSNGHYSCGECPECIEMDWPRNVRWATMVEQQNNRRSNVFYEYKDESHTIAQWGRITGIDPMKIRQRVVVHKWSIGEALGFEPRAPTNRWPCVSQGT